MSGPRYLTVKKFANESGYSEDAIRSKIRDGVWKLGDIWIKAPDDRVLIDVEGYETWVEMGGESSRPQPRALRSVSCIGGRGVGKGSPSSPPPLT